MLRTRRSPLPAGFTLIEAAIALALIAVLLSILLPALYSARTTSLKEQCAANLAQVGQAWNAWLADHDKHFPFVPVQPGWQYGGVRFSGVDNTAFPDHNRPLTSYLHLHKTRNVEELCVCCPADRGISAPAAAAGTGGRTAIESFGTSYRANASLLDVRLTGQSDESRAMSRGEVNIFASRLVLCGDPVWYEASEETGRDATWHVVPNAGNVLFLDGHVDFATIRPKHIVRSILFDPIAQQGPTSASDSMQSADR